jgi:GNAT superfamily N-acetyltransferase
LIDAFLDDPFYTLSYPDVEIRKRKLVEVFQQYVDQMLPHGYCFILRDTQSTGVSVALCFPPGEDWTVEPWESFVATHLADATPEQQAAFHAQDSFVTEHRELATGAPEGENKLLALVSLATTPSAQGRGLGTTLLRHIVGLADQHHWMCSLEATRLQAARIYERFGFVVHHTAPFPHVTPEILMYFMVRPAVEQS